MGEAAEILTDDAFELAFEAAAIADEGGTVPAEEAAGESLPVEGVAPKEEPEETTPAVAEEPEEVPLVSAEEPEETPPEPKEEPPAPKPPQPTPEEIQAAKDAERQAEEDRKAAEAAKKQAAEEASARENYTEEEQALINQASADFPEVSKALAAQHRVLSARFENVLNSKLEELSTQFEQKLSAVTSTVDPLVAQTAEQMITKAHPDAYAIHSQVTEWVSGKPAILRGPLESVIKNGTPGQVIELLDMYKSETGTQGKPEPTAEEKAAKDVKAKKKEEKLQSQEGVRAKSATSKTAIDPDDFDGAFEKFAAQA